MDTELKNLRIDRGKRRSDGPSPWAVRWVVGGVGIFLLLGAGRFIYAKLNPVLDVEVVRVHAANTGSSGGAKNVILNATGYIIAAHKIELASKVVGKVAWIGVEKGDHVVEGQPLVRLEDEEYRAHLIEAKGQLATLEARLAEAQNGSRPEEVAKAKADEAQARADMENARTNLTRTKDLVREGVLSKQALDDAQARFDAAEAKTLSFERSFELVRLGPRKEEIDALRAQVEQMRGTVDYNQIQQQNTEIRAPISGTILERNVEKGEFVTTGFVGDKGAKGYVVSLANLNDLQVELDINQNDFGKLSATQPCTITTDAYPDRKYEGYIQEISPEANRQKATVQVKVKVAHPDNFLRPEMNASVAFYTPEKSTERSASTSVVVSVPPSAIRDNAVFIMSEGKAVKKPIKVMTTNAQGAQVTAGLIGGEDVITNPPTDLKDGDRVRIKKG